MADLAAKRRARGEVTEADLAAFVGWREAELLTLLQSEILVECTCAAVHLRQCQNASVQETNSLEMQKLAAFLSRKLMG